MNPYPTISSTPPEQPAMNYDLLRQTGLRALQDLGTPAWTDFNAHDPGITILEQLCYAITDLASRIDYSLEDLLAGDKNPYRWLYSPAKILTSLPVTATDLRKWIMDLPGVKNAWFEPVEKTNIRLAYNPSENNLALGHVSDVWVPVTLHGLYRLLIERDANSPLTDGEIQTAVDQRLSACRSVGADFMPVTLLPGQAITVNATVEVGTVENPEYLLASIYHALENFISPRIRFYTLTEMTVRGKPIDEIFDGPALQHGFIDNAELDGFQKKTGLPASDLIHTIMGVKGVVDVSRVRIKGGGNPEDWYLQLNPKSAPYLEIRQSLEKSAIQLARRGIPLRPDPVKVRSLLKCLQQADQPQVLPEPERDVQLPIGQDREIEDYRSILYEFPSTYGIGPLGLSDSALPQRQAQAEQLKAYLLLFDQLLANSFAQLANTKELFSFDAQPPGTYFSQIIAGDGLNLKKVFSGSPQSIQTITEDTVSGGPDGSRSSHGRKDRFLNHLLGRFAEQLTDYSLLCGEPGQKKEEGRIAAKAAFLRDYVKIGAMRGVGFNTSLPVQDRDNVSGLERRIRAKLGLPTLPDWDLANMDEKQPGGFHILEHILLRPSQTDQDALKKTDNGLNWQSVFMARPNRKDPYSQQVSFIFPNWIERFQNPGFCRLIEKTLRRDTPAHLDVYLHWFDTEQMRAFESAYHTWREKNLGLQEPNPTHLSNVQMRDARDRMIEILNIGAPYPLRDLKLAYLSMVAYKAPISIHIRGGQQCVLYQLCDEDGNPIRKDGKPIQIRPTPEQAAKNLVFLDTPAITKDVIFTILATREDPGEGPRKNLECYLNYSIYIQVGINPDLEVIFCQLKTEQVITSNGHSIKIDYGDQVGVSVYDTQAGVSYKLVTGHEHDWEDRSKPKKGRQGEKLELKSNLKKGFLEDASLRVYAYRTASREGNSAVLNTDLTVRVLPNPAVLFKASATIINYDGEAVLTLAEDRQESVTYHLYKRDLKRDDYLSEPTPGCITVFNGVDRNIYIQAPPPVKDWGTSGFSKVGKFNNNGVIRAEGLQEDTLFIVKAVKTDDPECYLQLAHAAVVLVRPDPSPIVTVQAANVPPILAYPKVTVEGTQQGVMYQLRLANKPVNPPGYDYRNRAIGTMRTAVDLIVGGPPAHILLLPTGPIHAQTTFNVLAVKILTGVSQELNEKAIIGVNPLPGKRAATDE